MDGVSDFMLVCVGFLGGQILVLIILSAIICYWEFRK